MTEPAKQQLYLGCHRLLQLAKASGWRIKWTPSGHWRLTSPLGTGLTISPYPTTRGLRAAEAQFARIERANTELP